MRSLVIQGFDLKNIQGLKKILKCCEDMKDGIQGKHHAHLRYTHAYHASYFVSANYLCIKNPLKNVSWGLLGGL